MDVQNIYWSSMVQWKYDLNCAEYAFRRAVSQARYIKIFLAVLSSGAIASWTIWENLAFLWGFLIAAGQVCAVIYDHTPYQERIFSLSHMASELRMIYSDIEKGWLDVASGNLTESEICELQSSFSSKWNETSNKYFSNDFVSVPDKAVKEIDDITNQYFKNLYGVTA